MPLLSRRMPANATAPANPHADLPVSLLPAGSHPPDIVPPAAQRRVRFHEGRNETPGFKVQRGAGLLETCSNPHCGSGWLKLWRSRRAPVFEDGWCCSKACTRVQVETALRRELDLGSAAHETHRHRIPLGLAMLERGWITGSQLRGALEAQRSAGGGRLGHWLIRRQGVSEQLVTRALGLQWSCPVLALESRDPGLTALMPRLFADAFGALPIRVAAEKILYLGFEDRLDPVLALAIERMTGLRVECGLVPGSLFRPAHERMMKARYPGVELIEAGSDGSLGRVLAHAVERARPVASRLIRVHECLWLRMWLRPQYGVVPELDSVRDLICAAGGS